MNENARSQDSKEEQTPSHAQAPFKGMRAHRPSSCILGHISPMSVFTAMMDPRNWDPKKKIRPSQSWKTTWQAKKLKML